MYLKMEPDCRSDISICIKIGDSSDLRNNLEPVEKCWQTVFRELFCCGPALCDLKH